MDLLIDTYGTYIGCTGERIVLRFPKTKVRKEYPIRRLEKIVILRPSSISMHAVKLALEHDVDIVYLGSFGRPVGRIFASDPRGLATVRRAQLEASQDAEKTLLLAKSFVEGKCRNQISYLKYAGARYGRDFGREILQAETMCQAIQTIPSGPRSREQLLGTEGYIADKYWSCLRMLHKFPGRIPQGRDKFNSALNYGYGIVYNEIERVCLYVGLDPYLGLYHAERYGKPALVLDLIEEFRVPLVDSVIVPLFVEKRLGKSEDFERAVGEKGKREFRLSAEGKAKVVEAVLGRLNQEVRWKGKRRSIKRIIEEQVRSLSRYFLGRGHPHIPFAYSLLLT